jgi:hypothetical protein
MIYRSMLRSHDLFAGLLCGIIFIQAAGCGTAVPTKPNEAEPTSVEENATTLRAVYADQLDYLLKRDAPLNDHDAMLQLTLDYYAERFGRNSTQYSTVATAVTSYSQVAVPSRIQQAGPASLRGLVQRVNLAVETVATLPQFLEKLGSLQQEVLVGSLDDADKQLAMSYLILFEESMRALGQLRADGLAMQTLGVEAFSFWRCAAGVIGGAVLGGLNGAAAGSVIPGVGTTAGGVVGAVAGGLVGASASC